MSKSSCPWCNHSNITTDGIDHCCNYCGYEWQSKPTLFDRITASPEVLAEELVTLDCDGWWAYVGFGKRESYLTREDAIAETVKKLKGVEK